MARDDIPQQGPLDRRIPDRCAAPARLDMICAVCGARALIPPSAYTGSCPRCGLGYNLLMCTRCGNVWRRRGTGLPRVCPECKSPYWNRERTRVRAVDRAATRDERKARRRERLGLDDIRMAGEPVDGPHVHADGEDEFVEWARSRGVYPEDDVPDEDMLASPIPPPPDEVYGWVDDISDTVPDHGSGDGRKEERR